MTDAETAAAIVHEMQERASVQRRAEAAQRKADLAAYRASGEAKPKKRGNPERTAQQQVVAWLRQLGCIVSATQNERGAASDDPAAAQRFGQSRKRSGVTPGFPDITVLTPMGQMALVEMKAAKGRLSQPQIEIHAWLHSHGFVVIVARSIEDVAAGLQAGGIAVGGRSMPMAAPVRPLQRGTP